MMMAYQTSASPLGFDVMKALIATFYFGSSVCMYGDSPCLANCASCQCSPTLLNTSSE
jgi:hypothetical protein